MKTTAAILVETGKPLELCDLEFPPLKPGQALIEIACSGVCHTQVLEARGRRGVDRFLPHCLGHEGSGFVREVGPGVSKVKPDDAVILSWIKGSGADVPGSVYDWNGRRVNAGAITTFSRFAVISENRLTPLPKGMSLRHAALVGCAVPTGAGVVFNAAQPRPGQSIVIFGIGGIGACAVTAASISGCHPIIAVDVREEKLALAHQLGASHALSVTAGDPVQALLAICPGGVDFAIEATGRPNVMRQALASVRAQGGTAVVIGNAPFGEKLDIDPRELNMGKRLFGTWGGDNEPDRDYPRYCNLIMAGKLDVEPLLSRDYSLAEVNQALDDLERGDATRPIIQMQTPAA